MKVKILLLYILFLGLGRLQAQEHSMKPTYEKAVYFDISPPLRDMVMLPPGKADKTWKDGTVKNFLNIGNDSLSPEGNILPIDPGIQIFNGNRIIDTAIQNFAGLGNVGGYNPPDTDGDLGTDYYFQVVNCSYAIFNKTGGKIFGPIANSSVWNGMPNNANSGDAIVLYDEVADRWFFTQFSFPNFPIGPYFQMLAVSQTPDPTGSWYRWQFECSTMNDYPKFGIWPDGYYMSCNHLNPQSGVFYGVGVYAYDRDAMLVGDPNAGRISFLFPPGAQGSITMLPSDCDGPFPALGTPNYYTYIKTSGSQHLGIYEFHADWNTPANSTFGNNISLSVNPFSVFNWYSGISQMGTSKKLDPLSDRLMCRLQYRKFSGYSAMVVNHTINTGSNIGGIRWYELRNSGAGWSVYQQSTYAPADNNSRWMGSMAMDTAGAIALGYSISSSSMYPGIRYTGRVKSDPLNQMTISERTIIEGTGAQTGTGTGTGRWGDYSTMRVDPSSPTTFWYSNEYFASNSSGDWKTQIASFTFGNVLSLLVSSTPETICLGDSSQLNAVAYGGSSSYTYSWTSIPAGFASSQQNPVVYPLVNTQYIVQIDDGTQTRTDTTRVEVVQPPAVFAGNDTIVCWYISPVELHGTAENYRFVGWQTSGDGTFIDYTSPTTGYIPGPQDKISGSVELELMAIALSPCTGNEVSTKHLTLDPCTGITESSGDEPYLEIHPNPADNFVTITVKGLQKNPSELTLFNHLGLAVYSTTFLPKDQPTSCRIDLSGYSKGSYIVQLKSRSKVRTEKLLIR